MASPATACAGSCPSTAGTFIGTFEIGFDLDASLLEAFRESQGSDVSLFTYVQDPEEGTVLKLYVSTLAEPFTVPDATRQEVLDTAQWRITVIEGGEEPYSVITSPLLDHAGAVVGVVEISAPRGAAIQRINKSLLTSLVVGSVLLGASVLILWLLLTRSVIQPLVQLTGVALKLADGDPRVIVAHTDRKDEVGTLTRAFANTAAYLSAAAGTATSIAAGDLTTSVTPRSDVDALGQAFARMVADLRSTLSQVARAVSEVQAASARLVDHTHSVGDASRQIAATVEQVSAGTRQQADSVTHTANSMAQMKSAIEGVAQGAQEQASAMTLLLYRPGDQLRYRTGHRQHPDRQPQLLQRRQRRSSRHARRR